MGPALFHPARSASDRQFRVKRRSGNSLKPSGLTRERKGMQSEKIAKTHGFHGFALIQRFFINPWDLWRFPFKPRQ
jgi:hypothetical protein